MGRITRLYESLQQKRQKLDAVMPRALQDKALAGGAGEMMDVLGIQAGGGLVVFGLLFLVLDVIILPFCLLWMESTTTVWAYGGGVFILSLLMIWGGKTLIALCARNLKETAAQAAETAKNLWQMKDHPPPPPTE